ncbi:MAG: CD0415/CD1112 family protein [Oscillospiraceae bacterium]|nr:CD0415/CD1112 family protein [Oscillospiraceae bacterium]
MFDLTQQITDWINGLLIDGIISNFTGMFDSLNSRVVDIASQVGTPPDAWNANVFSLVRTLSETVVLPIAGMILTAILCYELIHMVIERNNMNDFDTFIIFKWIFKTFVAVYILTHTFDIVMAVFGLAQHVINQSAGVIGGSLNIDLALSDLENQLNAMETGELIGLYIESAILRLAIQAISLCVFIIIFGRMIEIYLVVSIAPIPLSTMVNREWGSIGNGYLKSLFALAFQGFLIMVCVAIYAALLGAIPSAGNIHVAVWSLAGYTLLLCFTLFKTGSLAKSIFAAN